MISNLLLLIGLIFSIFGIFLPVSHYEAGALLIASIVFLLASIVIRIRSHS